MSLETLPTETQCSIISLLDPDGLISISQTNTHFRRLVDPKKRHFAERLLYLETLPEIGGTIPIFRSRDNQLLPPWPSEGWETMRWACVGCNRLRSHWQFDNHNLLRLHLRKPLPASLPVQQFATWDPREGAPVDNARRPRPKVSAEALREEKKVRQRYFTCITKARAHTPYFRNEAWSLLNNPQHLLNDLGMPGFGPYFDGVVWHDLVPREMGLRLLDENALAVELERCGSKRHLRRCNECRYQSGQLRPQPNGHGGTAKLPIATSRKVPFDCQFDRYFPNLSDYLFHKRLPLQPAASSSAADGTHVRPRATQGGQLWTLWMARCPRCSQWKEMREFRCGGLFIHWKPVMSYPRLGLPATKNWDGFDITQSLLDGLRCNHCFAETKGYFELAQALLLWVNRVIDHELKLVYWQMRFDFSHLKDSRIWSTLPRESQDEFHQIIRRTKDAGEPRIAYLDIDSDIAILKRRRRQWRDEFWKQAKEKGNLTGEHEADSWFDRWVYDFDENEAFRTWLKFCKEELAASPQVLLDWALDPNKTPFT